MLNYGGMTDYQLYLSDEEKLRKDFEAGDYKDIPLSVLVSFMKEESKKFWEIINNNK